MLAGHGEHRPVIEQEVSYQILASCTAGGMARLAIKPNTAVALRL